MKKLVISALCGLCLMGALVATQASAEDEAAAALAIARSANGVSS